MRKSTSPRSTDRRSALARFNLRLPKAWSSSGKEFTPGGPLPQRLRRHLPAVLVTHASAVAVVVSLAIITILTSGAPAMTFPATLAASWLVTNGAPIGVGGTVLGVPPSLLAIVFSAWQAMRIRTSVRERVAISDVRTLALCALLVPAALTGIALGMVADASTVLPVSVEQPWICVAKTLVIALIAVLLGLGSKLWRALLRFYNLPRWLLDAGQMACLFLAAIWLAGAAATILALIAHASAVGSALATAPSAAGKAGLLLVSLLYLPTVALGGAVVMMGGEAHIGPALISIFGVSQAQLPPVPVLAAVPTGAAPGVTGFLVLVVPAVISVTVFRRHLAGRTIASPYLTVAVTAVIACVGMLATTWVVSGPLGLYGWTGITVSAAGLAALAWVLVPGVLYLAVSGWAGRGGVPAWLTSGRQDDSDDYDDAADYSTSRGAGDDTVRSEDSTAARDNAASHDGTQRSDTARGRSAAPDADPDKPAADKATPGSDGNKPSADEEATTAGVEEVATDEESDGGNAARQPTAGKESSATDAGEIPAAAATPAETPAAGDKAHGANPAGQPVADEAPSAADAAEAPAADKPETGNGSDESASATSHPEAR